MDASAIQYSSFSNPDKLKSMVHSDKISEEQKAAEVSRQFEGIMLRQYLNDALKPMFSGVLDENSSTHDIYRSFYTEAIADKMVQSGNLGLSHVFQAQLKPMVSNGTDSNNANSK